MKQGTEYRDFTVTIPPFSSGRADVRRKQVVLNCQLFNNSAELPPGVATRPVVDYNAATMKLREYIILAAGSMAVGVVLTFVMLSYSVRAGLDINENLWLTAIPAVLAILLNILLIEVYGRIRGKK